MGTGNNQRGSSRFWEMNGTELMVCTAAQRLSWPDHQTIRLAGREAGTRVITSGGPIAIYGGLAPQHTHLAKILTICAAAGQKHLTDCCLSGLCKSS